MPQAIGRRVKVVSSDQSQGERLRVVPIIGPSHDQPTYELLRSETVSKVVVTEVSESGHVPELQVHNQLDVMVFLMDGQELVGAKQNRILNTDVLVPARSKATIPVSCVEQGRWHHVSPQFRGGKSASHRTRSAKLERVRCSLMAREVFDADQHAVWDEVAESLAAAKASSTTGALSAAYDQRQKELTSFRGSLTLPEQAVGMAVFHGTKLKGLDLFDRHSTMKYFWESLVDSYALDLLGEPVDPAVAESSQEAQTIRSVLDRVAGGNWAQFKSPGEGEDWRLDDELYAASSLIWGGDVVLHLQVFPKTSGGAGREVPGYRPRIRRRYGGGQ